MMRILLNCILLFASACAGLSGAEQQNLKVTPEFLVNRGFVQSTADANLYVLESVRLKVAADRLGFSLDDMKPTVSQPVFSDTRTVQVRDSFFIVESEVRDRQGRIIRWSLDKPDALCCLRVSLAPIPPGTQRFDKKPSGKFDEARWDGCSRLTSKISIAELRKTADDLSAPREKRAEAVFSIFANYLQPVRTSEEVGKVLTDSKWLKDANLIAITAVGGKIPVEWTFEDTVYCLKLLPDQEGSSDWVIYLRLSGGSGRSVNEAREFLNGANGLKGRPKLPEFALCFPPAVGQQLGRIERFSEKGCLIYQAGTPQTHLGVWKLERALSDNKVGERLQGFFLILTADGRLTRLPHENDRPEQNYRLEKGGALSGTSPGGRFDPMGTLTVNGDTLTWRRADGTSLVFRRISNDTDSKQVDLASKPEEIRIERRLSSIQQRDELIEKLDTLPLTGASLGGPYRGIIPHETTQQIVAQGRPVVPALVDHLKGANLTGAIFTVFCLRQLQAKEARQAILQLQQDIESGKRFPKADRDLTLEMQIQFYLKDVNSWRDDR